MKKMRTKSTASFTLSQCLACGGVTISLADGRYAYEVCIDNQEAAEIAIAMLKMAGADADEAVALETMIPQGHA